MSFFKLTNSIRKQSNILISLQSRNYMIKSFNPNRCIKHNNQNLTTHRHFSYSRTCFNEDQGKNETHLISDAMSNESGQTQMGFIADSPLAHMTENFLINLHDLSGLEWAGTIFIGALTFRLLICFPIKIYQERLMAKLLNVQPFVNKAIQKLDRSNKNDSIFAKAKMKQTAQRQGMKLRNEIYKKEGCLPQKIPLSSFLQLPFWIYLTTSVRNLTYGKNDHSKPMEQIANESFLWIDNLSQVDPYYILPAIYAISAFGSIKYASINSPANINIKKIFNFRKYLTMTFICVITLLVSKMPASVGLFWIFSNSLSFVELLIIDSIMVKRFFKIPKTEIEPKNIYAQKYGLLLQKTASNLKWIKSVVK